MMVQGAQSPQFAMSTEAHPAPGANGTTGALPQGPQGASSSNVAMQSPMQVPASTLGKRKAETQENERLSKRLSLLNLEKNGNKLYVPVETPHPPNTAIQSTSQPSETMELDDSKHKVYIYNLDDELSSESEDDEGKLVFLPDIEKHLRETRIPQQVLANSDGELAGMQLILYSDPKSISLPEEKDSVRKAIIEARQRSREQQKAELEGAAASTAAAAVNGVDDEEMDLD